MFSIRKSNKIFQPYENFILTSPRIFNPIDFDLIGLFYKASLIPNTSNINYFNSIPFDYHNCYRGIDIDDSTYMCDYLYMTGIHPIENSRILGSSFTGSFMNGF